MRVDGRNNHFTKAIALRYGCGMANALDAVLPVAASIAPDWLRNLCSSLWAVPFLASILSAMIAWGAQRDRRDEQAVDDRFNNDLSTMCDEMEKTPALVRTNPHWRESHAERHRCARKTARRRFAGNQHLSFG